MSMSIFPSNMNSILNSTSFSIDTSVRFPTNSNFNFSNLPSLGDSGFSGNTINVPSLNNLPNSAQLLNQGSINPGATPGAMPAPPNPGSINPGPNPGTGHPTVDAMMGPGSTLTFTQLPQGVSQQLQFNPAQAGAAQGHPFLDTPAHRLFFHQPHEAAKVDHLLKSGGQPVQNLTQQQQHLINNGSQKYTAPELMRTILSAERFLDLGADIRHGDGALTREELSQAIGKLSGLVNSGNSFALRMSDPSWLLAVGPGATNEQVVDHYRQVLGRMNFLAANFSATAVQGGTAMVPLVPYGGDERMVDLGDIRTMRQANILKAPKNEKNVNVGAMMRQFQQSAVEAHAGRNNVINQSNNGQPQGAVPMMYNNQLYTSRGDDMFNGEPYTLFQSTSTNDWIAVPYDRNFPLLDRVPGKE